MEVKEVTKLFKDTDNVLKISCEESIKEFQEFLSKNPGFNKIVLIALNTKGSKFNYQWFKAQTLNSEGIAVLNLVIDDFTQMLKGEDQ